VAIKFHFIGSKLGAGKADGNGTMSMIVKMMLECSFIFYMRILFCLC